jgi:hypothetical chaperone protein
MSATLEPAVPAAACGIDFGTSNSTAGWSGKLTLPSVIFFHAEDAHVSYGRAALADYLEGHEGRMMRSLKSLLGTSMMDEYTEVAGRAVPFRALLAQFIGELKRRAEQAARQEFTRAVLGRPVFFVDDDAAADQRAQDTLEDIARRAGLRDIAFQYEPIAAAFDYESQISREELVLVVDIGGGTSDFTLIRVGPERAKRAERRDDILATSGVHIGGTDFDKALSLASMMPMLGLGSLLKSGREMPSSHYFNLATWHTINLAYTKKAWAEITELHRDAADRLKMERLQSLVRERAGHWLALRVEDAKIALSDAEAAQIDIGRISAGETVNLHRAELDRSIDGLVNSVEQTVARLLVDAGITPAGIDTVFFTGGSSGVPLLRERVLALTPQARCVEGDLFGSIGAGLALDAQRKFA